MKAGISLAAFAAEIERQQESKVDYVLDTRRLQTVTLPGTTKTELWIDSAGAGEDMAQLAITDHTHGQLADRLGIPKPFYDRLRLGHTPKRGARKMPQPRVFDTLVNGLLQGQPEKRMVRALDGKARAYLSNRYRPLDNYDLANAVLPIIGEWAASEEARVESCNVTDTRLYIKVVLPRIEREVKVGDFVQSGFVIQNSEVGVGKLSVFPMVFRLSCLNGMIREQEGMSKYHVGRAADDGEQAYAVFTDRTLQADDRAFWLKVQDVVRAAANDAVFEGIVARMQDAASSERIADPVGAVERIAGAFQLQEREQKSILAHLVEGGDLSAYGALNAITRASQDVEDYDRATDLEKVGARILDLSGAEWRELAAA